MSQGKLRLRFMVGNVTKKQLQAGFIYISNCLAFLEAVYLSGWKGSVIRTSLYLCSINSGNKWIIAFVGKETKLQEISVLSCGSEI